MVPPGQPEAGGHIAMLMLILNHTTIAVSVITVKIKLLKPFAMSMMHIRWCAWQLSHIPAHMIGENHVFLTQIPS